MLIRACLIATASAALVALTPSTAVAGAEAAAPPRIVVVAGSAEGFVKIDETRYPIRHAYALGVGEETWLLLTDLPVPDEAFQSPKALRALGFDGKPHGLLVTIDAHGVANPILILQALEVTGDLSWQRLELSKRSPEEVAGRIHTTQPHRPDAGSYTREEDRPLPKTLEYDISFKAPVTVVRRH